MKPIHHPQIHPVLNIRRRAITASAAVILTMGQALSQTTQIWTAGGSGALGDSTRYVSGVAPVNGDSVSSDGTGSVIGFDSTSTVTSLVALNLNLSSGASVFNQTSGTLSLGTLGFGGGGGSRNPTYNVDGGTLNISTAFSWGNGTNARFNQSAGIVNYTGGSLSIGVASGARGHITMTGGTFNASSVTQVNLGNTGSGNGQAYVNLSGDSIFNATSSTFVVGQFGAATGTNSFANLTLAGTSALNASVLVVGGNNAGSAVFGVINLNGGTISAGSIRKGNSTIASSITQNVLHANGGTVKAITHANNTNYFQNLFVDIQSGGLNFDTNGNDVGIANDMSGDGGFTKKGAGTLTFSGTNTYSGLTTVEAGTLINNGSMTGSITVGMAGTLGGSGMVAGATTINGILAIGGSPAEIGFGGDLSLAGTAIFRLGGSATPGTDYDFANVADTLGLGGALNIVSHNGYDLTLAAAYNLFDAGTVEGDFASVSVGGIGLTYDSGLDIWSGSAGDVSYQFSESDGVLTVVPEPASVLLGSLGLIGLLRRRRA